MNAKIHRTPALIFSFMVLNGLIIAGLILNVGAMAMVLVLGIAMLALFYDAPEKILFVLLFLFPFSGTALLAENLVPVPGFKPLQLFALFAMAIALVNLRKAVPIPPLSMFFFGTVISVFAFGIAHAYFYLDEINAFIRDPLTPWRFFLSNFCKPLIFILPALIMTKFVYQKSDFDKLAAVIDWSIAVLSIIIIALLLKDGNLFVTVREMRFFLWSSLGTHTNNLANYYILGAPFVLARFFQHKSPVGYLKLVLTAIGIALLFSRSAYCLFIIGIFLFSFVSKRLKLIPVVGGLLIAVTLFILPETVIQRATKGFETHDQNVIFAGRIDGLWIPLMEEYAADPKSLLLGKGRYAILSTRAHKMGLTIQSQHPHNMYLEAILDVGVFGLCIFVGLFVFLLKKCFFYLKYLEDKDVSDYLSATITSIVCFLLSGFTDRTFFPDDINGYLWIIVGFAAILFRYAEHGESLSLGVRETINSQIAGVQAPAQQDAK